MQSMIDGCRWAEPHEFTQVRPAGSPVTAAWSVPADLRSWVAPETLVIWVRDAVGSLDWDHPLVTRYLRSNPDLRPRALLEFLAYAYVTRVSGSEEILGSCRCEPEMILLCEGNPPFRQEMITFRRGNRKVLERVLADLYRRAISIKYAGARLPIRLNEDAEEAATARLNSVRHMDAPE